MSDHNSRETLVRTASRLFRQKGYSGVGLTEILKEAGLPKGSLYYHFPGGKAELADAATRWAGAWLEGLLNRTFGAATRFEGGALATCEAIATAVTTCRFTAAESAKHRPTFVISLVGWPLGV